MRLKWLIWWTLFAAVLAPALVGAQADTPVYTAFYDSKNNPTPQQVEVRFIVFNGGGDAAQPATAELRQAGQDRLLDSTEVPPIAGGASETVSLTFSADAFGFQAEQQIVIEFTVTSPEIEPVTRLQSIAVPAASGAAPPADGETAPPPAEPTSDPFAFLDALPFEIDLTDRVQLAIIAGVLLGAVVLIWLIVVILRLLFVRKPTFPANPPPYAAMPQLNPDTLGGRRQMWQQVAQHGSMFAEDAEGTLHARKLLMGMDDIRYSGWQVVGVRVSQYDAYGRVARSQVIAPNKLVRRLSSALERAPQMDLPTAERRARPVAKYLSGQLARHINRRTAALPVALDLKFKGVHGEVSILFELYQFQLGAWRRLDRWQPEMTVYGKSIYEGYTYTLHGQQEDENLRQFKRRVREDLTYLLAEMLLCTPPAEPTPTPATAKAERVPPSATPPTRDHTPPVDEDGLPMATSGMRPVPPPDDNADADNENDMDTVMRSKPTR